METGEIRVLIADDQALFRKIMRESLSDEPGIEVIAEASDGEEAIAATTEHAPQVVLMDVRMPRLNGIDATRALQELHPSTKVLMLTVSDDEEDLFEAIRAGALGYLIKGTEPEDIAAGVRQVHAGEAPLSVGMAAKLMEQFANTLHNEIHPVLRPQLTNPELRVLQHLRSGLSPQEVGEKLDMSESAVNKHMYNLLIKLHVHARMEEVAEAIRSETVPDGA